MPEENFADLLEPNLPAIHKLVKAKTRMSDDADDIVQQTLLQAFAHRHQLRVTTKFKSWLASIAINEIRGLARRTRTCAPLDELPVPASADPSTCPYKTYERREGLERLYGGLAELNDRDRTAIHLVDLMEIDLGEAAQMLSVTPAALKSTHFRARRRLSRIILGDRRQPRIAARPKN